MAPRSFTFHCPGCHLEIEIDSVSGKLMRHGPRPGEPVGLARFDEVLKNVKQRPKDALSKFDAAKQALAGRDDAIDQAFRDKLKKAKEGPIERPENPLDLD